jgi:hypothetical protein
MNAPQSSEKQENPEKQQISENPEKQQIPENPENPNDDIANQTVINLNKINNETNEKVETFLFFDSPFKSSINYILINIENLILKLFKTKHGYIITNKETNKIYVPYKQKLQPVPFNPYIPVSRIPKYVYMNIIPYKNNGFYLRKGDYYYYYNKYNDGLYSWYHWNNYNNKKKTRNLIEGLYEKIKHLEEKAFKNPPSQQSKPNSPPKQEIPMITINNTNSSSSNPQRSLEEQINKLPVIESNESSTSNILSNTNMIKNANLDNKINDAPHEELDKAINDYNEIEAKNSIPEPEEIQQPVIQQPIETKPKQPESEQPESKQPESEQQKDINPDEVLDIINSENKTEPEQLKLEQNKKAELLEIPKETFWSKFGF